MPLGFQLHYPKCDLGFEPQFNVHSGPKSNLDMAITCAETCGRALRKLIGWPECANFFSFEGYIAESTTVWIRCLTLTGGLLNNALPLN